MFGVLEEMKKHATPISTFRAYKLPGGTEPVKEWDLYPKAQPWPDRPFDGGRCIGQDDLEGVFRARLASYGVHVELGKGLVAMEQNENTVAATVITYKDKQPTEDQEVIQAKYLLGCDGARGVSRKLLGLTFEGETRDADGQVWGDVEIEGLANDFWHIWGQPGKFTIMIRPRDPGSSTSPRFAVGITGHSFDPAELQLDVPEKVEAFMRESTGRTELKFGKWTWLSKFKPNMRMVNTLQSGRAFCVGDAGHVHSPTGGQGMNNSVQDALNIGWKLSLVLRGKSSPELLKTYDEERLPIIALMLQATTKLYTHGIVSKIKDKADSASEAQPAQTDADEDDKQSGWFRWRNNALELYGINYRFSSIVFDERTPLGTSQEAKDDALAHSYAGYEGSGTLAAGDRLPDAPGLTPLQGVDKGPYTLLDLFKTYKHTVLVFPDTEPGNGDALHGALSITELTETYSSDLVQAAVIIPGRIPHAYPPMDNDGIRALVDGGHARDAYRVGKELTVVIARPDGYIGAVVKDAAGVKKYFDVIFSV